MNNSTLVTGSRVAFPEFTGERVYMEKFTKGNLPEHLKRWENTVDSMLDGINNTGDIFIMIDQSSVNAGTPQRRKGIHIDGVWDEGLSCHTQPIPGHRRVTQDDKELIILASDVSASMAYVGEWSGESKDDGDCSHVSLGECTSVLLGSHTSYIGTPDTLHESIPVTEDCSRTLVRLNVKLH